MKSFCILCVCGCFAAIPLRCNGKAVQKLATKPATRTMEHAAETKLIRPGGNALPKLSGNVVRSVSHAGSLLTRSEQTGVRLASLRPRIPPQVYGQLIVAWQRNRATIESRHTQLQAANLSDDQHARIMTELTRAEADLAEIERLTEQYG